MEHAIDENMPKVGDRVKIVVEPHVAGHDEGTVRQMIQGAIGIEFDSMPGEVHQWYVPSEVMVIDKAPGGTMENMTTTPTSIYDSNYARSPVSQADAALLSVKTFPKSKIEAAYGLRTGPLPAKTQWLRANTRVRPIGVDRENRVINGAILAEEGDFKTPGRGSFDMDGLRSIYRVAKSKATGLKARLSHATLSDDGVSKYLGRWKDPWMDTIAVIRDGEKQSVGVVRGNLHLSESAFEKNPNGNLGEYVLSMIEEEPDNLMSSLVIQHEEKYRLDNHGKPKLDADGNPLPPLWYAKDLHGADIVAIGDATNSLLGYGINADGLPDAVVRQACQLLDRQFADASADVIRARCLSWLERYLSARFLTPEPVYIVGESGEPIYHDRLPEDVDGGDDGSVDALALDIMIREMESAA